MCNVTGHELKIKRVILNLTQAQLAEKLGVSSYTVMRYENDKHVIPAYIPLAIETLERRQTEQKPQTV